MTKVDDLFERCRTDRPDDVARRPRVLPRRRNFAVRKQSPSRQEIRNPKNRKKTKTYPRAFCKIEYLLTSNHSDGSIASEFFTGDCIVLGYQRNQNQIDQILECQRTHGDASA